MRPILCGIRCMRLMHPAAHYCAAFPSCGHYCAAYPPCGHSCAAYAPCGPLLCGIPSMRPILCGIRCMRLMHPAAHYCAAFPPRGHYCAAYPPCGLCTVCTFCWFYCVCTLLGFNWDSDLTTCKNPHKRDAANYGPHEAAPDRPHERQANLSEYASNIQRETKTS
jgi:hypothetical protein